MTLPLLTPRSADACSCIACGPSEYLPSGGTVPANLPGLIWRTGPRTVDSAVEAKLFKVIDDMELPVEITVLEHTAQDLLIVPTPPFEVHSSYVLRTSRFCNAQLLQEVLTFATGEAVELPSVLGDLAIAHSENKELENVNVASGGNCADSVSAAAIAANVNISAQALPWRDLLLVETFVDGQLWAPSRSVCGHPKIGESLIGRGEDQFFAVCDEANSNIQEFGLPPGQHVVEFRARLPGSDVALATQKKKISLNCDPANRQSCSFSPTAPSAGGTILGILSMLLLRRRASSKRRSA